MPHCLSSEPTAVFHDAVPCPPFAVGALRKALLAAKAAKVFLIYVNFTAGVSTVIPGLIAERVQPIVVGFFDKTYIKLASAAAGQDSGAAVEALAAYKLPTDSFFASDEACNVLKASNCLSFAPCQSKFVYAPASASSSSSKPSAESQPEPVNPSQDSLMMARTFVRMFTDPGDMVGDFCSGSGTYSVAAVLDRRHAHAFDTDETQREGFEARLMKVQQMAADEGKKFAAKKPPPGKPSYLWLPYYHCFLENLN